MNDINPLKQLNDLLQTLDIGELKLFRDLALHRMWEKEEDLKRRTLEKFK